MKNLFGTDGIRGAVGQSPFTHDDIVYLGAAIGQWAVTRYQGSITMLVAHDTRQSCSWIKQALQTGLAQYSVAVIDAGVLPTPAVLQQVQQHKLSCGLVISASHNPYSDNGIKIMDVAGKITVTDEQKISELYALKLAFTGQASVQNSSIVAPLNGLKTTQEYISAVLSHFSSNFLLGKTVVLDCANGATYQVAPEIFAACGANVIAIHNEPNGTNINAQCGALHLQSLQQAVVEYKADMGFAFDGDGDRVIAVNCHGQVKDGDDLLTILLDHPAYKETNAVVGTIMSNRGFEVMLADKGKKLLRANVGDKYVAELLEKNNLPLGGEQSGHIIVRDYLSTGDGIFSALRVAHTAYLTGNWSLQTFTKYPQVMLNVRVKERRDLTAEPLATLIANTEAALGSGRLVIRYSGTEPLLRIMAEAPEHALALSSVQQLSEQISALL
jgi:phosphoglucosamine mutase